MKLFKCVRIFNKVFIGYNVYILRLIPKEQIVFDLGMNYISFMFYTNLLSNH